MHDDDDDSKLIVWLRVEFLTRLNHYFSLSPLFFFMQEYIEKEWERVIDNLREWNYIVNEK